VTWVHKINLINFRRPNQRFYLATRDSRPAGVCLLFNTKGIGGLYAVATLAEERGHGVAAALVARAVADSVGDGNQMTARLRIGVRLVVLHDLKVIRNASTQHCACA
jgi:GNAT superfamily N-acetyltransferase